MVACLLAISGCVIFNRAYNLLALSGAGASVTYTRTVSAYVRDTTIEPNVPSISGFGLSFSISPALPTGMAIDSSTGVISGRPTVDTPSPPTYEAFTVTATDVYGTSTTIPLSILVTDGFVVDSTDMTLGDSSVADSVCATSAGTCTFPAALDQAQYTGGQKVIFLGTGTYTFPAAEIIQGQTGGRLADLTDLVISGTSMAGTVLDGGNSTRIFEADYGNINLTLSNMTVQNARPAATGWPGNGGVLNFSPGGAAANVLTLDTMTFRGNVSDGDWGGVLRLQNATVLTTALVVNRSVFEDNVLNGTGGGGVFDLDAAATITDSTFRNNRATNAGAGAIVSDHEFDMTLTRCRFIGNVAGGGNGGAVGSYDKFLGSRTRIVDSYFEANQASGRGGGVYDSSSGTGYSEIENTTFWKNTAGIDGGGLYVDNVGTGGGGSYVNNSTFLENVATAAGGAIYAWVGTRSYQHLTVVGNRSNSGGGGLDRGGTATVNLSLSLFASNTTLGVPQNCSGAVTSISYNLIDTALGTCGVASGTDVSTASPGVASVLTDPSSIAPYLALQAGSPAIDLIPSGSCGTVLVDTRGATRPRGTGCDAGAFEY
jgi:hypothetical protein